MSGDNNMDRRRLLKSIAAGGALAKWPALAAISSVADGSTTSYSLFSPSQAALMESLVEQFVPADDFPGARGAGVVHYIDQKLTGPYGSVVAARYEAGLKHMDEMSRHRFHRDFASLDSGQQSSLLHAIADRTYGADAHEFLETALNDTFEGYYGNPADGGNRNGASWKMIGFRG